MSPRISWNAGLQMDNDDDFLDFLRQQHKLIEDHGRVLKRINKMNGKYHEAMRHFLHLQDSYWSYDAQDASRVTRHTFGRCKEDVEE